MFKEILVALGCLLSITPPQLTIYARAKTRGAPLQRQRLFPPHPAIFNFAFLSSAGLLNVERGSYDVPSWHKSPTISLGFVTSVVNLKRQDIHLYRASRSGPVQLYGIPCIGARHMPIIYFTHDTHRLRIAHRLSAAPQQTRAAREKVGRGTCDHLRREDHSPVIRY